MWKFYWTSADAYEGMLADCATARTSIDFEQYLFVNDAIGRRFLDVFLERARAGVRIRILLDAAGSFGLYLQGLPKELLNEPSVEVRFFNPISPWRIGRIFSWYFRDHRRILLVDNKLGYTGGLCIDEVKADWRETHLRIADPVVQEMGEAFERIWQSVRESGLKSFPRPKSSGSRFSFLINSPRYHQRFVYHATRHAIQSATASVYLTSPYFVPDPRFFRVLLRAARRGVDVRLLLSGPSNHKLVDVASNSYYAKAFRAGVRIFLYQGRRLHAKTAVIDERWASVGSPNLDNLSLLLNYEGSIVTAEPEMVSALSNQFTEDLTCAREVTREEWRRRPTSQKLLEKILWPLHRFL